MPFSKNTINILLEKCYSLRSILIEAQLVQFWRCTKSNSSRYHKTSPTRIILAHMALLPFFRPEQKTLYPARPVRNIPAARILPHLPLYLRVRMHFRVTFPHILRRYKSVRIFKKCSQIGIFLCFRKNQNLEIMFAF